MARLSLTFLALIAATSTSFGAYIPPPSYPITLEITTNLTKPAGSPYPKATAPEADVSVVSKTAGTQAVLVNGLSAVWSPSDSKWTATAVPLLPGINRVVIQALDSGGVEIDRSSIDIWYDRGGVTDVAGGNLPASTTWTAANGPYNLTANLTIPSGKTLTIEPGVTVYLANAGITINGKLTAQGTEHRRIRFTSPPATTGRARWGNLHYEASGQQNVLAYADIEYDDQVDPVIYIKGSQVLIDRITVLNCDKADHTGKRVFDIWEPKVTIRHSVFNDVKGHYLCMVEHMLADGWFIVDGNLFGSCTGDNDIFHLNHVSLKPGPTTHMLDNVFTGAGDDLVDDNETDTHIEGNFFFMDILNTGLNHPDRSASAAVTTGPGGTIGGLIDNLKTQHLTVVRNVFFQNQYGILSKTGAYSAVFNNVFVGNIGGILFDEAWRSDASPGRAAYVESSIFWGNNDEKEIGCVDDSNPACEPNVLSSGEFVRIASIRAGAVPTQLTVNNSLCKTQFHQYGTGNIAGDPKFLRPTFLYRLSPALPLFSTGFDGFAASTRLMEIGLLPDVRLQPDSPCLKIGFNGTDMGNFVPSTATISGVPFSPTLLRDVLIAVAGLDIYGYKYRMTGPGFDGTTWSPELMQWKVVNAITHSGTTATATTAQAHGYATGDVIEIIGADNKIYNGTFPITVGSPTTFTYTMPGTPSSNMSAPRDIWCRKPEKIEIAGLADGTYTVDVIRKNSIGVWQDEGSPTTATWTVQGGLLPTIGTVTPGEARPDTVVTIEGANFQAGIQVFFGGTPSPTVTYDPASDPDSLTAVVPDRAPGSAPVTVRNTDGGISSPAAFTVLPVPEFIRGDANMDSSVDISDAISILFHLFAGTAASCLEALDANSSEEVDISDTAFLLNFFFLQGTPPQPPFPGRGKDPSSALGCEVGLP